MLTCTASRYCAIWRSSSGVARTTMTPADALTITLRRWLPWVSLVSIADSEPCTSRQKSASEVVRTWAVSSWRLPGTVEPLPLPLPVLLPMAPFPPAPATVPLPPPPTWLIELDVTRMSLVPWRRPGR